MDTDYVEDIIVAHGDLGPMAHTYTGLSDRIRTLFNSLVLHTFHFINLLILTVVYVL